MLSTHAHNLAEYYAGNDHQQVHTCISVQDADAVHGICASESSSFKSCSGMGGIMPISTFAGQCHTSLGYGMQLMTMTKEEPP